MTYYTYLHFSGAKNTVAERRSKQFVYLKMFIYILYKRQKINFLTKKNKEKDFGTDPSRIVYQKLLTSRNNFVCDNVESEMIQLLSLREHQRNLIR